MSKLVFIGLCISLSQSSAAVSFFYVAWVWLGEIGLGADGTGLGTGFIACGFLDVVVCGVS